MSEALDRFVGGLEGVTRCGDGYTALCPAHDDSDPSLSIRKGEDGRVLVKCFSGCLPEQIVAALGMTWSDLFPDSRTRRVAITVEDLAEDKKIPAELLRELGVEDRTDGVLVPYFESDGTRCSRSRLRSTLRAKDGSAWTFGKGRTRPYGLQRISDAHDQGFVVIVEGESDCWALWHHGFPALGLPGATTQNLLERRDVQGISRVFAFAEPDHAGRKFPGRIALRLAALGWKGEFRVVSLDGAKDPSELHQQSATEFRSRFQAALDAASPASLPTTEPPRERLDSSVGNLQILSSTGITGLTSESGPDEIESTLREFAAALTGLDALRAKLLQRSAAEHMKGVGITGAKDLVDAACRRGHGEMDNGGSGTSFLLDDLEPWDEAVDGAELADEIVATLRRYVAIDQHGPEAVALWILHTYAFDATDVAPILAIGSPEKRCGKTTLLELVGSLIPRSAFASNISAAALYRSIEKYKPTLLVDEADTFLRNHEEMRGILNASHYRTTAQVIRVVGDDHEPRAFSTWCPKAIALIGRLQTTLEDRSILIWMRRRRSSDKIERLRRGKMGRLHELLRRKALRWALDHLDQLRDAGDIELAGLHDRALDNWTPLLAIADALGGNWPERARAAATALSASADSEDGSHGVLLLGDLATMFEDRNAEFVTSAEAVKHLKELEERPWAEYAKGRGLTPQRLSKMLKPFDVVPTQRRASGSKARGYTRESFADAFARYLPELGHRDTANEINNLDEIRSRDSTGTGSGQESVSSPQNPGCPDSESGRPDCVPTTGTVESGQAGPPEETLF